MNRRLSIMERVLARVRHEPPPEHLEHLGPCWIWEGPTSGEHDGTKRTRGHGYPRMCLDGQTVAVHRVTCTHEHGYLPSRRQVDHLCRRRLCVAPLHMEPVTHRVNQKRRTAVVVGG